MQTAQAQAGSAALAPAQESEQAAASWYVLPKPPVPRGWLVFSDEYVLRALQGKYGKPEAVARTAGWLVLATLIRAVMAAGQAGILLLSILPVLGWLMEMLATHFPRGGVGFFLRAAYWKSRLKSLGQDTFIERGVEIWGPRQIEIGSRCHIDGFVRLAAGEQRHGQRGAIRIGDFTHIGPRCHVAGRGGVEIGDFVAIEACVHIYSATNTLLHPKFPGQLISFSHVSPPDYNFIVESPVTIGDYATIGFASLLLPGARVGQGAIVHAYTQLNRACLPFANIVGPGRARQNGWRRPARLDPRLERGLAGRLASAPPTGAEPETR